MGDHQDRWLRTIMDDTRKGERARLADHLTALAEMEQEGGRRRAYVEALDDVASAMGLKREEKVTYSA